VGADREDLGRQARVAPVPLLQLNGSARSVQAPPQAGPRRVVGSSVQRPELAARFASAPSFIHDLAPPGLLQGRVLHPPQPGAALRACDTGAVHALPGARLVQRSGVLLGLVAGSPAQADAALQLLSAGSQSPALNRWPCACSICSTTRAPWPCCRQQPSAPAGPPA
jgi:hypothetical protein